MTRTNPTPSTDFLSPSELLALPDTVVYDPHSVLISRSVVIGRGNVFYPNAVIESDGARIRIGNGNRFYPSTFVRAGAGARVELGDDGEFGPGGLTVEAAPDGVVRIGNGVRLNGGAFIQSPARIGDGAQILGAILVRDVDLGDGGGHTSPDPDQRGGVLKGVGRAHALRVARGEVIAGNGAFEQVAIERQRAHHPDAPRLPQ